MVTLTRVTLSPEQKAFVAEHRERCRAVYRLWVLRMRANRYEPPSPSRLRREQAAARRELRMQKHVQRVLTPYAKLRRAVQGMTPQQRADHRTLCRNGYRSAEAAAMVLRREI